MDKSLFDRTVALLVPHMHNVSSRQALVQSALFGSPALNLVNWSGAAQPFTVALVRQLNTFDITAVIAVLAELREQVGTTTQSKIDALVQDLSVSQSPKKGNKMALDPVILMGFLLEIGRWAKVELSERWKVSREQQSADLTKKAEVEQAVPQMLQSANAASSPQRVEETIKLIERKRDAIDRARNAKLTHREERERGEITENMFVLRVNKEDETIRQMLNEIEDDLNDLGFDVEREPA